jgi:Cu/Ag efflux protein CusF
MNPLTLGLTVSVLVVWNAALAAPADPIRSGGMMMLAQAEQAMTDGEVRKIDKDAKKITLKHGEIKNLAMPSMTMVFQVKDPALLDSVKSGDKVRFRAENLDGALVVTRIEAATP